MFISGKRINSAEGSILLGRWSDAGHMLCNHSFYHSYYHSQKQTLESYENDFLKCDSIINKYAGFTKLFRFPFLKEGNTTEKRDGFRDFLRGLGYKHGYATLHIKHTLLLHHNYINALFLDELISFFKVKGWDIVNAGDAFKDEVFTKEPDILPAGESIIWALAKETGKYENMLRYPGEDSEYEEIPLNNLLKTYFK